VYDLHEWFADILLHNALFGLLQGRDKVILVKVLHFRLPILSPTRPNEPDARKLVS
jgi:hypothetical protein